MPTVPPEVVARRLGERMLAWRVENGVTQQEAGERLGRAHQQWSRWERSARDGRNPALTNLMEIADVMGVELPDLVADLYWPRAE